MGLGLAGVEGHAHLVGVRVWVRVRIRAGVNGSKVTLTWSGLVQTMVERKRPSKRSATWLGLGLGLGERSSGQRKYPV